jgi:hypothetical protein
MARDVLPGLFTYNAVNRLSFGLISGEGDVYDLRMRDE